MLQAFAITPGECWDFIIKYCQKQFFVDSLQGRNIGFLIESHGTVTAGVGFPSPGVHHATGKTVCTDVHIYRPLAQERVKSGPKCYSDKESGFILE